MNWRKTVNKDEMFEILRATVEFYADPESWKLESDSDVARRIEAIDCGVTKRSKFTGGVNARRTLDLLNEYEKSTTDAL
jgi:hypothetical protein